MCKKNRFMKKILLLTLCLCMTVVSGYAQKKKNKNFVDYSYELSLSKDYVAATSGFKVFKVWSYGKKKESLTQNICMRNAIHGILFKGLAAADVGTQGLLRPLCPEGYEAHKEYFDHFFDTGEYQQFIQLTSRGFTTDVIKTANKEWKVGLLVQVNLNALRKRLETDGILDSARNIFSR